MRWLHPAELLQRRHVKSVLSIYARHFLREAPCRADEVLSRGKIMKTAWIYIDNRYQFGHPDHVKIFASAGAANDWFKKHDPEGCAFEYDVIGQPLALHGDNDL